MIDADTLTAAILAAGYTTEEIARIADARRQLPRHRHARRHAGRRGPRPGRIAQRHDQLSDLATLIMDTAAGKKPCRTCYFGGGEEDRPEWRPTPTITQWKKMFAQQQRQIDRLTDRMDAQDRRIDAQDRNIENTVAPWTATNAESATRK